MDEKNNKGMYSLEDLTPEIQELMNFEKEKIKKNEKEVFQEIVTIIMVGMNLMKLLATLEVYEDEEKKEKSFRRKTYRYHANYFFDAKGGFERDIVSLEKNPEEILIEEEQRNKLYECLRRLTKRQENRIYKYFILVMDITMIAEEEHVKPSAVTQSINAGLTQLRKMLREYDIEDMCELT